MIAPNVTEITAAAPPYQSNAGLLLEQMLLVFNLGPFLGIGGRVFFLDDGLPDFCELGIQRGVVFLRIRWLWKSRTAN